MASAHLGRPLVLKLVSVTVLFATLIGSQVPASSSSTWEQVVRVTERHHREYAGFSMQAVDAAAGGSTQTLVWTRLDDEQWDHPTEISQRRADGQWTTPSNVFPELHDVVRSTVAMDGTGRASIAACDSESGIVVRDIGPDGSISDIQEIAPSSGCSYVEIESDPAGALIVGWIELSTSPTRNRMRVAVRPSGGEWTPATTVVPRTPWGISSVDVGISGTDATAVWNISNGPPFTDWTAYAVTYRAGMWSERHRLSRPDTESGAGSIDVSSDGRVVAWQEQDFGFRVWARRRLATGWGTARFLGAGLNPRVSVNQRGEAVVAFNGPNNSFSDVSAVRLYPSRGWGSPARLTTGPVNSLLDRPDVTIGPGGRATVVWQRGTYSGAGTRVERIEVAQSSHNGGWNAAQVLASVSSSDLDTPRVLSVPGVVTVSWAQVVQWDDDAHEAHWDRMMARSQLS